MIAFHLFAMLSSPIRPMNDAERQERILIVEDDGDLASVLKTLLERRKFSVSVENRAESGFERATGEDFSAVVTDLRLPGMSGMELMRQLHAEVPELPVVIMTAHGNLETAIEATKQGAFDYIVKPFKVEELAVVLHSAAESRRWRTESESNAAQRRPPRAEVIGKSSAMQAVYKELGRVAATDATVLICGETGAGKELVARAICQHSPRKDQRFVAVNCSAIPETLLESELFGHEKGGLHRRSRGARGPLPTGGRRNVVPR